MGVMNEKQSLERIVSLIKEWAGNGEHKADFNLKNQGSEIDLILQTSGHLFLVELRNSGTVSSVNSAIDKLDEIIAKINQKAVPVVAVPFMGDVGRQLCSKRNVSWLDLSGNANIVTSGLRVQIEGKPNQFKRKGRPKNVFAPKSSRIARRLLIAPGQYFTQRELTHETKLDEGLVSRVVREMEKSGLLIRNESGAVKPKDPDILLDAWSEKYSFSDHRIIKGFVAERNSTDIVANLAQSFRNNKFDFAVTGLSAAWLMTHFAAYRTSTIYLSEEPSEEALKKLNFVKEDRGTNVWLVIPNDEGVFDGSLEVEKVRCVSPVQVYLDLKGHPERAKEAAENLREQFLKWEDAGPSHAEHP